MPDRADTPPAADEARVAGHRLVRRLGSGALGSVWLALTPAGEPVALKLLAPESGSAGHDRVLAQASFLREADAARRLPPHPDIVAVRAAGVERGNAWLVMELAPGRELSHYGTVRRLLPEPVVLGIGERLARALAHAHAHGVVHRDVKPSNVLLDLGSGSLKLTDFGTARVADAERTRTGLVLGTPLYMAPEQLGGAEADPAADQYALGTLLFELFTGRLPFAGDSLGELLRQVAQEPAPALHALRPDWPQPAGRQLAAVVARTLAKLPSARHAGMAALADALAAVRSAWPRPR